MILYIDFDHTLYNTNELITDMEKCITDYLIENGDFELCNFNFKKMFPNINVPTISKDYYKINQLLVDNFKRPEETLLKLKYNIYELAKTFTKIFNCNYINLKGKIDKIINNGAKYLYNDSIKFLKKIKNKGIDIYILSHEVTDLNFQHKKIIGSGIFSEDLINGIIITKVSKAILDEDILNNEEIVLIKYTSKKLKNIEGIDYQKGIFIDDRPKDLEEIGKRIFEENEKNDKVRMFRIRRNNSTYSKQYLDIPKSWNFKDFNNLEEIFEFMSEEICGVEKK